jgi:hypothetical protein
MRITDKFSGCRLVCVSHGDGGVVVGGGRTAGTALAPGSLDIPGSLGCSGVGVGRRLALGGRPGVADRGSLGTAAPSSHNANRIAAWGSGSRRGSVRGRRTSSIRTRAEGSIHSSCSTPSQTSSDVSLTSVRSGAGVWARAVSSAALRLLAVVPRGSSWGLRAGVFLAGAALSV